MDSAVYHFYPNATSTISSGNMNNALIYFSTSDSTGHAVNGIYYDINSGNIWYNDYQNNTSGVISVNQVSKVYYP
jgi:hypothetical protein